MMKYIGNKDVHLTIHRIFDFDILIEMLDEIYHDHFISFLYLMFEEFQYDISLI
jgi:hypothetical protein